ncbi:MAG: hypothetical protein WCD36_12770, partial [Rhodanobacteraceae bacterium]
AICIGDAGHGWPDARTAFCRPQRSLRRACTDAGVTGHVMEDLSPCVKKGSHTMSPHLTTANCIGDAGHGWPDAQTAHRRPQRSRRRACTDAGATGQVMEDVSPCVKKAATP